LTEFLDDSTEMMTSISIRMSVIELLEECFFTNENFDRSVMQRVLEAFFLDNVPEEFYKADRVAYFTTITDVQQLPVNFLCLPKGR